MRPQKLRILRCCAGLALLIHTSQASEPAMIVSHIRRQPLASSALATAGYSRQRHILEIEFCNGAIYRYLEVPPAVYRELMSAKSKTHYYDSNIKGQFQSLRLRLAEPRTHED